MKTRLEASLNAVGQRQHCGSRRPQTLAAAVFPKQPLHQHHPRLSTGNFEEPFFTGPAHNPFLLKPNGSGLLKKPDARIFQQIKNKQHAANRCSWTLYLERRCLLATPTLSRARGNGVYRSPSRSRLKRARSVCLGGRADTVLLCTRRQLPVLNQALPRLPEVGSRRLRLHRPSLWESRVFVR